MDFENLTREELDSVFVWLSQRYERDKAAYFAELDRRRKEKYEQSSKIRDSCV
jgi:hypothetical protein